MGAASASVVFVWSEVVLVCTFVCMYHSLAKEWPLMKVHPPPTFYLISCLGSMFTKMRAQSGVRFVLSLRSTASSAMHIWGKKTSCILHWMLLYTSYSLRRWTQLIRIWCIQSVVCRQDSSLKPLVVPLYVISYLLQGHRVAVNMIWALFCG